MIKWVARVSFVLCLPRRSAAKAGAFVLASSFVLRHSLYVKTPSPQTLCPPNSGTQAFQLHDLAMIDKQIHLCAVVLDVPREYIGISGI